MEENGERERERNGEGMLDQPPVDCSPLPLGSASTGAVWKCWSNISSWLDRAILLSRRYRDSLREHHHCSSTAKTSPSF